MKNTSQELAKNAKQEPREKRPAMMPSFLVQRRRSRPTDLQPRRRLAQLARQDGPGGDAVAMAAKDPAQQLDPDYGEEDGQHRDQPPGHGHARPDL